MVKRNEFALNLNDHQKFSALVYVVKLFQFFTLIFGSGKPSSQNNISSVFEFCVKSLLGETKVTFFLFFNNEIVTAVELIPDPIISFQI